jgi:hypothetical protein
MGFLRKHQKKLFLVITVITIASFSFFGAVTPQAVTEEKPKKIGEKMDGSQIYDKDVKGVVELLQIGGGHLLKTDFIEGGIFSLLAEKYFEQIAPEFKDRLEKAKAASFYSHPQAPFISAIQVWSRYSPQLAKHLREVKAGSCSASTFAAYAKLYVEEQNFPPELLRSILLYEQQNMGSISPDPQLSDSRNLALFGHYTFEDWFGREFSTFLGKFILNTAVIAHENGYRVSL